MADPLLPYQITAAEMMAAQGRYLLADAPRVGKTAAAIGACDRLGAERVLWITTGSARIDHARAWKRFSTRPRDVTVVLKGSDPVGKGITIISYDLAVRKSAELAKIAWDAAVLDECHKLKSRTSARTLAILGNPAKHMPGLVDRAKHVFALSGTPAPNNYSELWPLLRSVFPETLDDRNGKPMTYWTFTNRYCVVQDNGFGLKITGSRNALDLKARIHRFTMRRVLADIAPQVPKLRTDVLALDGDVNALKQIELERTLADLAAALRDNPTPEQQDAILRRAAVSVDRKALRLTGLAKLTPLLDWIYDEEHEKLVIFGWHTELLWSLRDALKGSSVLLDGSVTGAARQAMVDRFRGDKNCRYFVGQIKAAGEAIDLSIADEVVFAESSWVPGDNEQACMRVVNINKTRPTLARFATIPGSLDEQVQKVAARKLADIRGLFK